MKKMNLQSFTLACIASMFFIGCTQESNTNPNAFRLEDGPNGVAGGSRYGYLGADQVQKNINQSNNQRQDGTVFLDPSNPNTSGQTGNSDSEKPKYPVNGIGGASVNANTINEPPKDKPTPVDPKQPAGNKPYANPVPGKVGHVYSPFANGREVDVTGFPPGTEVRCPYTKMIFRVP